MPHAVKTMCCFFGVTKLCSLLVKVHLVFLNRDLIIMASVEDDMLRFDEVMEVLIVAFFYLLDVKFPIICADGVVEDLSSDNDSSMSSSLSSLSFDKTSNFH